MTVDVSIASPATYKYHQPPTSKARGIGWVVEFEIRRVVIPPGELFFYIFTIIRNI
jgi:hypothetical protein